MTDTLFQMVASYGAWIVFAATFLSCLAAPVPSSLVMLAGGAFVASGDLSFWQVSLSALTGAVLGDQTGYRIARMGGRQLLPWLLRKPTRARLYAQAATLVERHGGLGVFFSRWLVSPLGPWVNLIAGATSMNVVRFTVWDIAGEMAWVAAYVGLGYVFASQLEMVSEVLGNMSGLLAAGVVVLALGHWLRTALRLKRRQNPLPTDL